MATTSIDPARFGVAPKPYKLYLGVLTGLLFFLVSVTGPLGVFLFLASLIAWVIYPSRRKKVVKEQARRVGEWNAAFTATSNNGDEEAMNALVEQAQRLELTPDELQPGYDTALAIRDLLAFERLGGGSLKTIDGHAQLTGGEPCYFFEESVVYDKRGPNDESGRFLMTPTRAMFIGPSLQASTWAKVIEVRRDNRTLAIQHGERQTPNLYIFDSLSRAMIAEFVAKNILANEKH